MKLSQTQDYLLLIDEEIVCKTGEFYLTSIQKRIIPKSKGVIQAGDKIIAYYPLTKEAKELDLPLLPPFKDVNIEELAEKWYIDNIETSNSSYNDVSSFIEGYKAAQSDKQFSLEDMKKALSEAFKASQEGYQITADEIIQSLSTQQLPKEFVPEYDIVHTDHAPNGFEKVLKFKTNSEGKQELVGTYKY